MCDGTFPGFRRRDGTTENKCRGHAVDLILIEIALGLFRFGREIKWPDPLPAVANCAIHNPPYQGEP